MGKLASKDARAPLTTIRQDIIELLEVGDHTARDLSQALGIPEREVHEHLEHVAKTVEASGRRLVIVPSECLKCGHVFEGRTRTKKPSKCPDCKGTRIRPPAFRVDG